MSNVGMSRKRRSWLLGAYFLALTCAVLVGGIGRGPIYDILIYFMISYWILLMIKHFGMLWLAFKEQESHLNKVRSASREMDVYPLITILVPAYNEADVIADSLKSLKKIDYDPFEVIVIDDGSTDGTSWVVHDLLQTEGFENFRLVRQKNSGKSSALNNGILHSFGEFILCVDADSVVDPGSLRAGILHFQDPQIGAVAGHIHVASHDNFLLNFQDLEYQISLNFIRSAFSYFGCVPIVPGPSGLFRKKALRSIGCYREDPDNFAEDADLSLRLLAKGWKIGSEEKMISYTEAPESLFALLRQRYRWQRGLFQAWKANWLHLVKSPQAVGPFLALVLMHETFVSRLIDFFFTVFLASNFLFFTNANFFNMWFAGMILLDLLVLVAFCRRQKRTLLGQMATLFGAKVTIHFIFLTWGLFALWDEWTQKKMTWDKLNRTGQIGSKVGT